MITYVTSGNTYDLRGNRTKETVTGDENYVVTNTYDANNRLTNQSKTVNGSSAENVKYYYDANGNQTFKQKYNYSQGGLMSIKGGNYQSGTVESFTYNLQNQLTGYQSSTKRASYDYGADGLRKSKTVNNVTMEYVWDRGNLAAEVSGNTIVNMYNYGPDGITSKEARNGDKTLYLKNAHGDVVGISGMSGNVFENYRYDAFGNVLSDSEPDCFGYCGEFLDNESGLVYLRNRYYDTAIGRFITEDPIRDGLNWYGYCGGNPIMFVDPIGTHDVPLYDGDTVYDVRYDIRELIELFGGVLKVEDNIVKIKALGKVSTIDLAALSAEEEGMRAEDRHLIQDSLHYTLKEFLNLIGADYKITTAQIEVTDTEVRVQKFEQFAGESAVNLLQGSFESVVAAMGVVGQAITSISDFLGFSWGGNYDEILTSGFYKKQFIEIFDEHGRGIITNYITQQHTTSNTLAYYYKELWNADMNEMAFYGWQYP